jgi:diguanylate cyclase (GGDEF)-like protein
MNSSISMVISILAFIFYATLFWIVVSQNNEKRISRYFGIYLVTMAVWSFGSLMIFIAPQDSHILFWNRFMLIGSTAMPVAFFGFVQIFLMRKAQPWIWLGITAYLLIQAANYMGWMITDAQVVNNELYNTYGPALTLSSIEWVFFIGFATLSLFQEYRKSTSQLQKMRIKYLIAVIVVIFAGSLTNLTPLQHYPIDITFNIVSALLIAYAIFYRQLLDTNEVIRKGLSYSIPTFIIGTSYFLIIYLVINAVNQIPSPYIFIISLSTAILTAFILRPIQEKAQLWIDRLFYREKYDAGLMMNRLAVTANSVLALDKLTELILREVVTTLHIRNACFFLKHGENGDFYLMAQTGLKITGPKLRNKHPLIDFFAGEVPILSHAELDILPQFHALWKEEKDDLVKIAAEFYIPLKTKGRLIGIFAIGPKRSGLPYSRNDQATLVTLGNQMATAIENALVYESEIRHRKEAENLQSALLHLTTDVDLELVLDTILANLASVIPYDSACIYLLEKDIIIGVAERGLSHPENIIGHDFPLAEDRLLAEIQHTRRPYMIPDIESCLDYKNYGGTDDVRSWMGVPLISRGTVIGFLILNNRTLEAYCESEQANLAQAFAGHASIVIENARLFKVEREQRQLAEALREIGAILSTTLDFDSVLDLLLDQIGRVVPYSIANIILVDDSGIRVARTRYHESLEPQMAQLLKTSTFNISPSPNIYYMIDTAQTIVLPVVPVDAAWIDSPLPVRSWVGAPVIVKGKVIACFSLSKLEPDFYMNRHAELLSVFAGQAALALQNSRLFSEIQKLAIQDDLTGVFNRRHFLELGEREFNRAQRYERPLSVIMLDIDRFKKVNDTYGHTVGDQVLRVVVERCKSNIREVDILARYGGEEFTIILPEAGPADVQRIAERLRKDIAKMPISTSAGPVNITVSMGAASLSSETPNLAKLIDNADFAMYKAKKIGRNYVCVYDEVNS